MSKPRARRAVAWPTRLHADDAEPLASDLSSDHEGWAPGVPFAGAHQSFAFAGAPGRSEHQQHRDLCCRIGQHIWRVGDDDISGLGRGEIDIVGADREADDGFD